MLTKSGSNIVKTFVLGVLVCLFCPMSIAETHGQNLAQSNSDGGPTGAVDLTTKSVEPPSPKKPETVEEKLSALQQSLEQLQKTVEQQQETIRLLALPLTRTDSATVTPAVRVETISDGPQT